MAEDAVALLDVQVARWGSEELSLASTGQQG
jgi:hypothetical protein